MGLRPRALAGVGVSSFWLDRPVLITGASGLVGGWLSRHLLAKGAAVVCLIRDRIPSCELRRSGDLDRVAAVTGDVRDQALLERALGEYEIDTVFHLAAQTIVGTANRNPVSTFESNIQGTWALLEACRRSPSVRQIVVASSDKAYGDQEKLPYTEETPLQGRHPYDVSKSCSDLISQAYAHTYGLPVAITRCGNFYGGGDLNWNRIVPGSVRSIIRGQQPVIRSDGSMIRDYFYVEDGALAYMTLAEHLAGRRELSGRAFNFSNEVQMSVIQMVQAISRLMCSSQAPEIRCEASNEIPHQYLSARSAREELGWKPTFSLDDGLKKTIEWYRRFLGAA